MRTLAEKLFIGMSLSGNDPDSTAERALRFADAFEEAAQKASSYRAILRDHIQLPGSEELTEAGFPVTVLDDSDSRRILIELSDGQRLRLSRDRLRLVDGQILPLRSVTQSAVERKILAECEVCGGDTHHCGGCPTKTATPHPSIPQAPATSEVEHIELVLRSMRSRVAELEAQFAQRNDEMMAMRAAARRARCGVRFHRHRSK